MNLADLGFVASTSCHLVGGIIIPANNLILGCLAADVIVADTETHHVDTHVGGRLIRIGSIDTLEERIQYGIDFDIPIIVHRYLVIGIQMEGVYHVDIIQVGSGSLIGYVDRMLEGQIPHREGLKLAVSRSHTPLVLIV